MAIKVGITGGIGSGKSVVSAILRMLGYKVLDADKVAKYIMQHDASVIASVSALLGPDIYDVHGVLDRKRMADIIFSDIDKKQALNRIVHPATISYIDSTMREAGTHDIIFKEAAIMVETGSHRGLDFLIGVDAPIDTRIQRAMLRDNVSREDVMRRIGHQMDQQEKMRYCDTVIINNDNHSLILQTIATIDIIRNKYYES